MRTNNIYEYLLNEDFSSNSSLLFICKNDKEALKTAHTSTLLDFKSFILPDIKASIDIIVINILSYKHLS